MKKEELINMYPNDFLKNQSEIHESIRSYVVDYLAEMVHKFKLWHETLYVCVGIMDKFLSLQENFKKSKL